MPDDVKSIQMSGYLLEDYLPAIDKYRCSFGDCSFEKIKEDPSHTDGSKQVVYVWKKTGELHNASALRGLIPQNLAMLMHQWVPSLSEDFCKAMAKAGMKDYNS